MKQPFHKIHLVVMSLCAGIIAATIVSTTLLSDTTMIVWGAEDSFFEIAAAVFYVIAAIVGIIAWRYDSARAWPLFSFFMLCAGGRELDWHKKFTTLSVFKPKLYILDTAPMAEKLGGGVFMIVFLYAVAQVLRRGPQIWRAFWDGTAHVVVAIGGVGLIVAAKFMDGFYRYVPGALANWAGPYASHLRFTEEVLEHVATGFFIAAPLVFLQGLASVKSRA